MQHDLLLAENKRLQRCIGDLVGVMALPAMWVGREPSQIAGSLLDSVLSMLDLDFAHLHLNDADDGLPVETMRLSRWADSMVSPDGFAALLAPWSGGEAGDWPPQLVVGGSRLAILPLRLGLLGDIGSLVVGSRRGDFPRETESLLLNVAANQAIIGLQAARRLGAQALLARELDQRVEARTRELAEANEELRRRELDLQLVVDSIPVPVTVTTPTGEVEGVNRPTMQYFGRTFDELKQWTAADVVHPDDLENTISAQRAAHESGHTYDVQSRHRRHDGVYRWFNVLGVPVRDPRGRILRWFHLIIDIDDRKRAEEGLAASERNLAQIVNTIPGLAWSARVDGFAEFFNQHYLDYVGLTADEARGSGWAAAVHPDDLPGLITAWHEMLSAGRPGEAEARLRRVDGEYRWFLFRTNPLQDNVGTVIKWFGVNTDIEDRKRAERALRTSEWKLRQLTETIPQMLWSATPDGAIDYCNARLLDFTGFSAEEVMGGGWTNLLHPGDVETARMAWLTCIETGEPYQVEVRTIHAVDGTYRWLLTNALPLRDGYGSILRWYGTCIDIHDRKEAEAAIAASEWNLRRLTETIPQMLWSATPEGAIDYCNARLLDFTGFTAGDIMGDGWKRLVHPDDLHQAVRAWSVSVATGTPFQVESRVVHPADHSYRWCLTSGLPLRDAEGRILKWYGACVDMHDWKEAQDELRDTQAELAHVTRVMTMGQLTASIAHELNQPLAGIMTNASTALRMLTADPPNVDGARETARRTIRDAKRTSEVITRLRALFTKRSTASEVVDLNTAAQEVVALSLTELQKSGVSCRVNLAANLPDVMGDRIQLQQVILNLLLNGAESMRGVAGRSGELVVSTDLEPTGGVRLAVRDAGTGFDPATAAKLFSPFYTTKSNGMGIGLSVSRTIVENHQGRLWAERNEGPGSTFCFSIPSRRVGESAKVPRIAPAPQSVDASGST